MSPLFPRAWARASRRRGQRARDISKGKPARGPRSFRLGGEPLETRTLLTANLGFAIAGPTAVFDTHGYSVATDAAGDVYMMSDIAVSKYHSDGTLVWSTPFSAQQVASFYGQKEGLAVDALGDVYITGGFNNSSSNPATFGPAGPSQDTLFASGSSDVFLVQLDAATGNVKWAESFGGLGTSAAVSVAVDSSGNAYLTGTFNNTINFGNTKLVDASLFSSDTDAFIAKVGETGAVDWAQAIGNINTILTFGAVQGNGIAVDQQGNVFTTGSFSGTVDFDPAKPGVHQLASFQQADFILKLDTNGNFDWVEGMNGQSFSNGTSAGESIAVDAVGNIYSTGTASGTVNLDPSGGSDTITTAFSDTDAYVLKLDPFGKFVWASDLQVTASSLIGALTPEGITIDNQGNVYTTGRLSAGTADFDPGPNQYLLSTSGFYDGAYVSALDSKGNFGWAVMAGGNNFWDTGYGIATSPIGKVYVAGTFYGPSNAPVDFDPGQGVDNLTSGIGTDSFLWGLTQPVLSGTVWIDKNGNGKLEAGEPGVAGAVVNVYASKDGLTRSPSDPLTDSVVTDAQGHYALVVLNTAPKLYVQMRPPVGTPPGFTFTSKGAGAAAISSAVNPANPGIGETDLFGLNASQVVNAGILGTLPQFGFALGVTAKGPAPTLPFDTAGTSITTDKQGDIYVAGTFKGTRNFDVGPGSYTLTSGGGGTAVNVFVAKYTATGALIWVRSAPSKFDETGANPNAAPKIALDGFGNLYIAGLITGTTDFSTGGVSTPLTPNLGDLSAVFLWKLDSQGNLQWATKFDANQVGGLAVDSQGDLYVDGGFSGTVNFDPSGFSFNSTFTAVGLSDVFVTEFDNAGALLWAKTFGSTPLFVPIGPSGPVPVEDQANGIAVDSKGNVAITGSFQGSIQFSPLLTFGDPASLVTTAFAAELDNSGAFSLPPNLLWADAVTSDGSSAGTALTTDAVGNVYVTGTLNAATSFDLGSNALTFPASTGGAFVAKLDSTGAGGWIDPLISTGDAIAGGIALDSKGTVYATGGFSQLLSIAPPSAVPGARASTGLTASGSQDDVYLVALDGSGSLIQAEKFGGAGEDYGNALATDSAGDVFITGAAQGPANFDPGIPPANFSIGPNGQQVPFLFKLYPPPTTGTPNMAPSFLGGADQIVQENAGPQSVSTWATSISPGAATEGDQALNFLVTYTQTVPGGSPSTPLFAVPPAIDPATGMLTYTPAPNASGTAMVTVQLRDSGGTANGGVNLSATQTFMVTVNFVNLPPTFTVNTPNGGDQTVLEDSGAHLVPAWASNISPGPGNGDQLPANSILTFNIAETNPAIYAAGGLPQIDSSGNLSYVLAPDASGTDTVTVTLSDSGSNVAPNANTSAPITFHINAQFVNDVPMFAPGPLSETTNEDAGAVIIPGWATSISPGEGANEQNQKAGLYFTLTNDHPELFSVLPAVDPATGNLTFTPKPDAASADVTDHITVLLHDTAGTVNGGVNVSTPQQLAITVNFVNDAPAFNINPALPNGGNQLVRFDSTNDTVVNFATNLSPGSANEASQKLDFVIATQVAGGDPNLFNPADGATPPSITLKTDPVTGLQSGTLTYTPAPGLTGTATVTLRLHDNGGTAHGGVDLSPPQTFTIDVEKINLAPSFAPGPDQPADVNHPVLENSGAQSVVWATNISAGPSDESTQKLRFVTTYQILSGDADLFTAPGGVAPSIDPNFVLRPDGVLTYTPAANRSGVANVSVYLQDDGGTAFGGIDTSPIKTFRIAVTQVNTAPSFAVPSSTVGVNEDTQAIQAVPQFATNISPGLGPQESNQKLTFHVVPASTADATLATSIFAIPPAIDPTTGTLTYELQPNEDGTVQFNVTLQDNGGTANGGVDTSAVVPVTFHVNFVNDPPVVSGLSDQILLENTTANPVAQSIPISLSPGLDANEKQQHWTVTISDDNPGLFANTAVGLPAVTPSTGQGTTPGVFTFELAPSRSGVSNIAVTITDDGTPDQGTATPQPLSFTDRFRIIASPVNTPPQFQFNPAVATVLDASNAVLSTTEDSGTQALANFLTAISPGSDPAEAGQKVSFQTSVQSSTNPNLFVIPPAIDASGKLTYTLAPDQNGSAVVSVVAHDDGGTLNGGVDTSQPKLFAINALYVNDPPTFTSSGDQTVNENAGVQRVPLWATNMSPGEGTNEVGQALHFVLTPNDATSSLLFLVQPTIDSSGNLLYSPAPFAHGTGNFTVTLVDDGGTANGGQNTSTPHPLSITINYVNAPPRFAKGLDQVVDEDSGPHTVSNWASAIFDGQGDLSNQPLTFTVQAADPQSAVLFSTGPSIDSSGTLTFTPAPLASGVGTFTATLSDGGSMANGGQITSVAETFHITVNRIDHAPTLANPLGNAVVNENAPPNTFRNLANVFNDLDIPLGDKLTLSLAGPGQGSSNPSLVVANLSGTDPATATLTLTYEPNQSGMATIDLRATDQAGKSVDDIVTVTVKFVNQPPSFTAGGNVQVGDTAGNVVIPGWATGISAGPPSEASQVLAFEVTGITNPGLFNVAPTVSPGTGNLSFATRPGVTGSAAITLVLKDDGGTANGGQDTSQPQTFNITVGSVPTAKPDSYLLGLGTSDSVTAANGVLINDSISGGGTLTAQLVQGPAHGQLLLHADGSFTYVKGASFAGLDQFIYEAVSGGRASNPVTVQLTSFEASVVDKVYQQVLGRPADSAGLQYWTAQIESGQPYGTVAQGIFESDEHLDPIIEGYYQQFLLRPADPSGLAHWDQVWKEFGGPANVIAGMISSPEFFQSAGGTNSDWVSAIYQRLLDRPADQKGLQYWTNQLNQNLLTRPQVVLQFEDSQENDKLLVIGYYNLYLQRNPTQSELNQAVAQLQAGATPRDIQIGIINSFDYQNTPPPPPAGTAEKLS